jgi:O-antigen/teichoic acid export membrane protein
VTLRGLARGSVLYSIGFVLPRIGTFLLLPVYVTFLSTEDFGAIALVVSVAQLLASVLRMGMDGALIRLHFDAADRSQQQRLLATVATLTLIVALVGALLAGLLAWAFFAVLFAGLAFLPFGLVAAVLSFSTTFQYLPATVFRAREEPSRFLAFTGSAFLITAAVTLLLVVWLRVGVLGALIGHLAGGGFVVIVSAAMLIRASGPLLDRRQMRESLRFGLPLVPHALAGWLLNVSDRWLLSFLLQLPALQARSAIGVYSLGYQLAYAVDLLAQSFNAAWGPFFYRYGSTPQGPAIHREVSTLVMAAFGALAALVAINATLIVTVIARPAFAPAAGLIPILSVAFTARVFYMTAVTVIFHERRTGVLPVITGGAAAVNVVTNALLIPPLGITGAAWATLAAFVAMAAATYVAARRVYLVRLDWARLIVLCGMVVATAAYALSQGLELTLPRLALDGGVSLLVVAIPAVAVIGPLRALRRETRAAAAVLRSRGESADR